MMNAIDIPTENLPLWMRRARQSVDWGILITLFFSLMAAWPFISQRGLPHIPNAENHVYAAADYAQAFREGVIYPRWSATAAEGYGAPIYNYRPPGLSYLAGSIEALLTDQDSTAAMRGVLVGAFALAGAMTYVLVLRVSGAIAGIVAAVLYVFSPYVGLTAPHLLGDYPAVLTFALLPALLWSVSRLLTLRHPLDFVSTALICAAFLLTDPQALLPALGLVALIFLWVALTGQTGGLLSTLEKLFRLGLALAFGVSLSAFYWWPALREQAVITWTPPAMASPDYQLSLMELLTPPKLIDLNELLPLPQFRLGLPLIITNALALTLIAWEIRHGRRRLIWHLLFFGAGVTLLSIAVQIMPSETWLLGAISLCFALSGSALAEIRHHLKAEVSRMPLPFLLLMILALSVPVWLAPRWSRWFGATDQNTLLQFELNGYGLAVIPPGELLPLTVTSPIIRNPELIESYATGTPIRIPNIRLTGEKRANFVSTGTHRDRYVVDAESDVIFDILRAYDPAWKATLNGEPVEISVNAANGLMQVRVPRVTDGLLVLSYGTTPERTRGWLISGITLLTLTLWLTNRLLRFQSDERFDDLGYVPVADARLIGLLCAGFAGMLIVFVAPDAPATLYPRLGHGIDHYVALEATTTQGFEVLAYSRPTTRTDYTIGETFEITLVWRANDPIGANYQTQLYLVGAQPNLRWLTTPPRYPAFFPMRRWRVGHYIRETYTIPIRSIVTGEYQVAIIAGLCGENVCDEQSLVTFYQDSVAVGTHLLLPFTLSINFAR